jgi:exosome complex component RRP43
LLAYPWTLPSLPFFLTPPRTHTLTDPTAFEEPLLDTTLSVVLDSASGELISVSQVGLGLVPSAGEEGETEDTPLACISAAKKHCEELVLNKIYA